MYNHICRFMETTSYMNVYACLMTDQCNVDSLIKILYKFATPSLICVCRGEGGCQVSHEPILRTPKYWEELRSSH